MVVVGVYFDFSVLCMQCNVTSSGIYLLYHLYHNLNNEFPYLCVCFYHSAVMYLLLLCTIWLMTAYCHKFLLHQSFFKIYM